LEGDEEVQNSAVSFHFQHHGQGNQNHCCKTPGCIRTSNPQGEFFFFAVVMCFCLEFFVSPWFVGIAEVQAAWF
jgi:hypothetical protein